MLDPLLIVYSRARRFDGFPGKNISNCIVAPPLQTWEMKMGILLWKWSTVERNCVSIEEVLGDMWRLIWIAGIFCISGYVDTTERYCPVLWSAWRITALVVPRTSAGRVLGRYVVNRQKAKLTCRGRLQSDHSLCLIEDFPWYESKATQSLTNQTNFLQTLCKLDRDLVTKLLADIKLGTRRRGSAVLLSITPWFDFRGRYFGSPSGAIADSVL